MYSQGAQKHAAAVTNSERKEKVSKVDHHISRGNEYFAASKWCRALEHYIRALDKVERESEGVLQHCIQIDAGMQDH